jgi:hypothetical protein
VSGQTIILTKGRDSRVTRSIKCEKEERESASSKIRGSANAPGRCAAGEEIDQDGKDDVVRG